MKNFSKLGVFTSKGRICKESSNKYRSSFQRDRDRIIHSASFRRLNGYLAKYTNEYFLGLLNTNAPTTVIYKEVQKAVSDYFVALQLAPLTTHQGYRTEKGSTVIKDTRPTAHGEASANTALEDLEAYYKEGNTDKENDPYVLDQVLKYWDPGSNMNFGIDDPKALALVKHKLEMALSRAFPLTWKNHKDAITMGLDADILKHNTNGHLGGDWRATTPEVATAVEDVVEFHAQIQMGDSRTGLALPAGNAASHYAITGLQLPDDRPMTKYGQAGQKSHTVAWTLMLKTLRNMAAGGDLLSFLKQFLRKWEFLKGQNWDLMVTQNLISSKDLNNPANQTLKNNNARNKSRLAALQAKIDPGIAQIRLAIGGAVYPDVKWTSLIQSWISDFMEISQSSPLASYKDGMATGHGEADANDYMDYHTREIGNPRHNDWNEKFCNEVFKDKGLTGVSDYTILKPAIIKVRDHINSTDYQSAKVKERNGTPLSPQETLARQTSPLNPDEQDLLDRALVKQLGLKYLDIKWTGVMERTQTYQEDAGYMAQILHEWENSIKGAYPEIWKRYRKEFQDYANEFAVTRGHQADLGQTTMSHLMEPKHYTDGLESIQSGDLVKNGSVRFNQAKQDYTDGVASIQGGNNAQNGTSAFNQSKQDYTDGVASIQGGNNAQNGTSAFNQAKQEYINGMASIQGGNNTQDGTSAFNQAKADFQAVHNLSP